MKKASQPSKPTSLRIAAAIPAFNEEKYIGTIVLKTLQYVDEAIVLDDGSTDQTAKIAELAGARVIRHGRNKGYGASIQSLLAEAKKNKYDILVLFDADAQHDPDDIPKMIQPISEEYDLVIGSRKEQSGNIPRYRRAGQKVIGVSSRLLSGENLSDSESGFRVFSRNAIEQLELKENGMAVSAETIVAATEKNLKITERPISIRYTEDGSTLHPVVHGFEVMRRIIAMISERRPLFFFGFGGLISILIGFAAAIRAAIIVGEGGGAVNGYTLVALMTVFIGVLSIFTGIILNVLMKRK